jgi:inner membrane protein YidH
MSSLGSGPDPAAGRAPRLRRWPPQVYDVGTEPDPRFSLANERTFLAWIRTALGFLAAGVAVAAVARLGAELSIEIRVGAVLLITAGLLSAVVAFVRWARAERAIRLDEPLPASPAMPLVTIILAVVAIGAVVLVLLA